MSNPPHDTVDDRKTTPEVARSSPGSPGADAHPGVSLEDIRIGINGLVPFQRLVGAEITELGAERSVAVLPSSEDTLNHVGTRHAAAIFLLAEAAAGAALAGILRERILSTRFVLKGSKISYHRKVVGELRAVAEAPKRDIAAKAAAHATGESFEAVIESVLSDADGERVADAVFTYHCRILAEEFVAGSR